MMLSRSTTGFFGCVAVALLVGNVHAVGNVARRSLADNVAPAVAITPETAPAPTAVKNVNINSASGFASTVMSGATDMAQKVVSGSQGFAEVAKTVADAVVSTKKGPIMLMHGAIQGGEVWEYPRLPEAPAGVKGLLEAAGYNVYNPTLPYHFPNDTWTITDGFVTIQQYVDTYINVIKSNDLHNVYLVGHSLAGLWMQELLQQIGDRIGGLVFLDAVCLLTGESFFSNGVAGILPSYPALPTQAFFTLIYSYPMFYQELTDEIFRKFFINTRANDLAFVEATYKLLVPEPHGPELQKVNTTDFFSIPKPKAFVNFNQDITLGPDYKSWLLFSDRIAKSNMAGVEYKVYTIYGDHESMLTQQFNLATGILQAVAGLQG